MSTKKPLILAVSLACAALASTAAMAATPTEINNAIAKGLDYLHTNENATGYWTIYGGAAYSYAAAGSGAFAMLSQKTQWGANASAYQADVDKAMNYLLSNASVTSVNTRNDGVNICPGGSGSCTAVWWAQGGEDSYTTGLVASAIGLYGASNPSAVATATGPLAGMTWTQIAQGLTNTWAASQSTANQGNRWGGWRYGLNDGYDSDSSTTQWGAISLIYDKALGATTPAVVLNDLKNHWYPAAQAADGSACYQPGIGPCDQADTGGMLLGLDLVGGSASAINNALAFLNANWPTGASGTWYGIFGQPYAMWGVYKGLETTLGLGDTTHITNLLDPTCGADLDPGVTCNWWQDMNQWLVENQNADGGWNGYAYWTDAMPTAFYLPILGGTAIPQPPSGTPEPATLALLAIGLAGLGVHARRRKN